jgi:hypothetical protein
MTMRSRAMVGGLKEDAAWPNKDVAGSGEGLELLSEDFSKSLNFTSKLLSISRSEDPLNLTGFAARTGSFLAFDTSCDVMKRCYGM